jgi:hypothetical protein
MKFNLKDFEAGKIAVNCETASEAEALLGRYQSGLLQYYRVLGTETCYYMTEDGIEDGGIGFYAGYKPVIPYREVGLP